MHGVNCRHARLLLQAPDELGSEDAASLGLHLRSCGSCSQARIQYGEVDRLICDSLSTVVAGASVRGVVQARLRDSGVTQRRRGFTLPRIHFVPVAAIAACLALLASFLSPSGVRAPQTVAAGWRLVRPEIGYPLTVDRLHPSHLLAGAFGAVYESWNAGNSWHTLAPLPNGQVVRDLAVDISQPARYLIATKHSVFVSNDRGRHWHSTVRFLLGAMNMFITQDASTPSTFYLGPSVLWRSDDHGETWRQDGQGSVFSPDGIQALEVAPNGTLYTGIWQGGVAISHDGGLTWQRRISGLRKNVMNVVRSDNGSLWAATDRGAYVSRNNGDQWRSAGLPRRFFDTSILAGSGFVLAGGNGGVYRSTDNGGHWTLAMKGLPLDPYVYGFVSGGRPGRIYASLDSDGLFRSDNGGRTWKAINTGLPLKGGGVYGGPVLFLRHGDLWHTDSNGADPGNLTVEHPVHRAVLTPDGAAAAYVTGDTRRWSIGLVNAGGSRARILLTGTGQLPRTLLWSPDALRLAVQQTSTLYVVGLDVPTRRWRLHEGERLVSWNGISESLLFWEHGRLDSRDAITGHSLWVGGSPPALPLAAPDGSRLATVSHGSLLVSGPEGNMRAVASVSGCRAKDWSGDTTRLLLTCTHTIQVRSAGGQLIRQLALPASTRFSPGANDELLYYQSGSLWNWSPAHSNRLIVGSASTANKS